MRDFFRITFDLNLRFVENDRFRSNRFTFDLNLRFVENEIFRFNRFTFALNLRFVENEIFRFNLQTSRCWCLATEASRRKEQFSTVGTDSMQRFDL